jgi:phosphoribosyl-ATP pyrophosphohydrolase/phosphoribosyl-AMP cyclohydrolase
VETIDLDALDFTKANGLVTVVVQDDGSRAVLMVAHADREALERTLETGEMHFRSRSRGLWRKGATSGNTLRVVSLVADCDGDAVLARVVPAGPTCHTGAVSCFAQAAAPNVLADLDAVIAERAVQVTERGSPVPRSYTRQLLADRNLRLKKLGEEAAELVTACADGDRERGIEEAADVIYHALVAVRAIGGAWTDIEAELVRRGATTRRADVDAEPRSRGARGA